MIGRMETTVRALVWARVRHFVVGVVCVGLAYGAFTVRNELAERERRIAPAELDAGLVAWVARRLPATDGMISGAEWMAIIAVGAAWYQLREWRGKSRRYRNQRLRAANELLRGDFRRHDRF
jgi:hypothetical protein